MDFKLILGALVIIILFGLCVAFILNKILNNNRNSGKPDDSGGAFKEDSDGAFKKDSDGAFKKDSDGAFKDNFDGVFKKDSDKTSNKNSVKGFKGNFGDDLSDNFVGNFGDNLDDNFENNFENNFGNNSDDNFENNLYDDFDDDSKESSDISNSPQYTSIDDSNVSSQDGSIDYSNVFHQDGAFDDSNDSSPIKVTKALTIYSGNTDRIKVKSTEGKPENITYTSEDPSIAEVVNGIIIANREGTTTIHTAFSLNGEDMSFHTSITVLAGTISVWPTKITLMEGTGAKIRTKVKRGVLSGVSYSSSNLDVATVVNDGVYGVVTGISQGEATIIIIADVSGTKTVKEVPITVSAFKADAFPIHNPVNANDFTEKDDWQGSRVYFGVFEQDNKISNGKEPILWRVLEVTEDSALLLSEYGLICKNIHETFDDFTWETCSLRNWLNTTFLDIAFTNLERRAILNSNIKTLDSNYWGTEGGNDTIDKAFILTIQDVMNPAYGFQKDMKASKTRMLQCTTFARKNGGYMNKANGNTCWWLRSPAFHNKYASYVFTTGAITATYFVGRRYDAIRPAIRVDLSAIDIKMPQETGENVYPHINVREY